MAIKSTITQTAATVLPVTAGAQSASRKSSEPKATEPRIVTAVQFRGKMRGGSQAHLLKADDGCYYVTKFRQNPQGRRILINELLASNVLEHLGIAARETVLVRISAGFLRENSDVYISQSNRQVKPQPGVHFGSAYPFKPSVGAIYDFLPEALLHRVLNTCEFAGALVFDKWVCNADYRQAIFFRPTCFSAQPDAGVRSPRPFVVNMIDNGFAFSGVEWVAQDNSAHGVSLLRSIYQHISSLNDFEPWLTMVMQFPEERLWGALATVPDEWFEPEDRDALIRLIEWLCAARTRVPRLLQSAREVRPELFPNWA